MRLYIVQDNACVADSSRIADIDLGRSCVDIGSHRKLGPKPFTGGTKRCLETLPFMVSKEPLVTRGPAAFKTFYASFDSRKPRNLSAFKALFVVIISLFNL